MDCAALQREIVNVLVLVHHLTYHSITITMPNYCNDKQCLHKQDVHVIGKIFHFPLQCTHRVKKQQKLPSSQSSMCHAIFHSPCSLWGLCIHNITLQLPSTNSPLIWLWILLLLLLQKAALACSPLRGSTFPINALYCEPTLLHVIWL